MSKKTSSRPVLRRFGPSLLAAGLAACSGSPAPPAAAGKTDGLRLSDASRQFLEVEAIATQAGPAGGILPGRVAFQPQAMASVDTPVEARIVSIDVRPGEVVKAGAPLVTLQSAEAASARAVLDQATAQAAVAEDLLRRQSEMLERGVGLDVERFGAETAAREARAELERARRTAALIGPGSGDRFVLRAPVDGTVLAVHANVGAVASPGGETLIDIGDPRRLWVVADIPEGEAAGVAPGLAAHVRVPGADASFEATVDGVGQVVDSDLRRLPIYLALKDDVRQLIPGMLAEVRLGSVTDSVLDLPTAAVLIKDGSQRVVYVQRADGGFERRHVRTGRSRDGRVTIVEGLRSGEKVVVQGALLLDSEAEQLL